MKLYLAQQENPTLLLDIPPPPPPPPELVLKGMYDPGGSDDWLRDFEGTALFNAAVKLCERASDLKFKLNNQKEVPVVRQEFTWDKLERVRLEKRKLALQLAKLRHAQRKQMDDAMAVKSNGQKDLSDILEGLMGQMPGEDLTKEKK